MIITNTKLKKKKKKMVYMESQQMETEKIQAENVYKSPL